MWIWQQPDWPGMGSNKGNEFRFDSSLIAPSLRRLHFLMGILVGKMSYLEGHSTDVDILLAKIVGAGEIVGRKADQQELRSDFKCQSQDSPACFVNDPKSEGLVLMYLDARSNLDIPLTLDRMNQWNIWQCAERPSLLNRRLGGKLRNVMCRNQVQIAVKLEKTELKFDWVVPDSSRLGSELQIFMEWYNDSKQDPVLDPFIRAGIAHLWFLALQPFQSANIQMALLLSEFALAQAQPNSIRFYAMSAEIAKSKHRYYNLLDESLRGSTDITSWLIGFLDILESAVTGVLKDIEFLQRKVLFWHSIDKTKLSSDKVQFIDNLIDGNFQDGICAKEYGDFMRVSSATATRHLAHFLKIGCLTQSKSGGRSTKYFLKMA